MFSHLQMKVRRHTVFFEDEITGIFVTFRHKPVN
jgi:hypothetical protein